MKKTIMVLKLMILVSGILFAEGNTSGNVFYNHTTDLGEEGSNAFNMKRAYLTFSNDVSDKISYIITYDMGSNESGSAHTAFLKVAMVKWNTALGDISLGMQGMNMFKTMENTWGHRFIQKTPMDIYEFSHTADLGMGITRTSGPISTSALITNGSGFKKAESDSHKKISLHAVYGESNLNKKDGFNSGFSFSYEPGDKDSVTAAKITVMGLFGGFSRNGLRAGLEFDTKDSDGLKTQIISAYATYKLSDKLSFLTRLDQLDPDTAIERKGEQGIIAGVLYNATKGLTIAPTLRMTKPENAGEDKNSIVINFQFKF